MSLTNKKPIGVYGLTNTASVLVYDINDEQVLAGINDEKPLWRDLLIRTDDMESDELEYCFRIGAIEIPLSEVLRI